jgi:hypothetical protein
MLAAGAGSLIKWYEVAGIILALPVVGAIVWAIVKVTTHLLRVHEVIIGRPATAYSEKIPSMVERFATVNDALGEVTYTLTVNGEVSDPPTVLDRIMRGERETRALARGLDEVKRHLTRQDVAAAAAERTPS